MSLISACSSHGKRVGDAFEIPSSLKVVRESKISVGAVTVTIKEAEGADRRFLRFSSYETKSDEIARQLLREKTAELSSVYDNHIDPYFAAITKGTSCPEKFQPRKQEVSKGSTTLYIYSMFATDRNAIGACSSDLASKRALIGFLVCGAYLFEIEQFSNINEDISSEILKETSSLQCLI